MKKFAICATKKMKKSTDLKASGGEQPPLSGSDHADEGTLLAPPSGSNFVMKNPQPAQDSDQLLGSEHADECKLLAPAIGYGLVMKNSQPGQNSAEPAIWIGFIRNAR